MNKKRYICSLLFSLALLLLLTGCGQKQEAAEGTDYSDSANWAYLETDETGTEADVFFICPSVYGGSEDACNMSLTDEDTKESFVGAISMEKGIYEENTRFFAPYYRQIGLNVYEMPEEDREPYLEIAYEDVRDAFDYYCDNYNARTMLTLCG